MGGVIQRVEEFDLWKVPEINLNEQTGMDISFVFIFKAKLFTVTEDVLVLLC
jgi:hypothetical protein